ncbi:Hypothetical protein FKW44_010389, partial [Caligus rogercresseyi]
RIDVDHVHQVGSVEKLSVQIIQVIDLPQRSVVLSTHTKRYFPQSLVSKMIGIKFSFNSQKLGIFWDQEGHLLKPFSTHP